MNVLDGALPPFFGRGGSAASTEQALMAFVSVAFNPFHCDIVGPEALDVPRHGFPKVGVGGGKVLRSAVLEVSDYGLGASHHILVVEVSGGGLFSPLEGPEEGAELSPIAGLGVGVQGFTSVPR